MTLCIDDACCVSMSDVCLHQDGLMSSTDAALRDLSGACLKEFVHWSIKQSTPQVNYDAVVLTLVIIFTAVELTR